MQEGCKVYVGRLGCREVVGCGKVVSCRLCAAGCEGPMGWRVAGVECRV